MLITPNSRIILLKNPIEIDYMNELTFSNELSQRTYFSNLPHLECDNATYQRKDDVIRFPTDPSLSGTTYEDLLQYNYCMYQNTAWDNKWFYAFVKKVTFDNPGMSLIEIETDVYQTWMFNITWKKSFVEREHVNDDSLGINTTHEGLDTGEFVINEIETFDEYVNDYLIIAGVTKLPKEIYGEILGNNAIPTKVYNGTYSGLYYITFQSNDDVTKFMLVMDGQGLAENIYSLFVIPKSIVTVTSFDYKDCDCNITIGSWTYSATLRVNYKIVPNSQTESVIKAEQTITRPSALNGYTPKNNKMFTGEYNYMLVTNNAGSEMKYNYEDFYDNTAKFSVTGDLCPGCSIRLIPKNYKKLNQSASQDYMCNPYGLTLGKFPTCSWTSDSYTNWLTQQSVNIMGDRVSNIANTLAQLGTGNISGGSLSLINGIRDELSLNVRRDYSPVEAKGNINAGDVNWAMGINQFVLYKMSVRYEVAKRIDDYFSMFGYKVNELKIPNIEGRTNWNYVKTIGCNIIGDIPQDDIEKIKEIFNNGVTLWHNPSTFLDYSQSNTIVR